MEIGFIGVGNMGLAIIKGLIRNDFVAAEDIHCYNRTYHKLDKVVDELNVTPHKTIDELIDNVSLLVLAVKPQNFDQILREYHEKIVKKGCIVVSIAAGYSIEQLEEHLGKQVSIIRVLPTVAALVNESVSSVCANKAALKEEIAYVIEMFNAIGSTYQIDEKDIATFTSITGCALAFNMMYINALATAGVKNGLSKDMATKAAAESMLGSAKMFLQSNEHAESIVDKVTSPGGTTIAGVAKLHELAFTSTVIQAAEATIQKDKEISEGK